MDKTFGDLCPRCGNLTLSRYYEEGADIELGARCEECGFKGFSVKDKLVQMATI
jgi:predicted RNA-binding Zn-ribbon protein involved in translation (DUF1610 family)